MIITALKKNKEEKKEEGEAGEGGDMKSEMRIPHWEAKFEKRNRWSLPWEKNMFRPILDLVGLYTSVIHSEC